MFENAREYLARVVPWPQGGDEAYVNIHWTWVPKDHPADRKPLWSGRPVTNLQEAINTLGFALKGETTRDVYVCMSTQRVFEERLGKDSGKPYRNALRSQPNAVALKAFWFDIDLKEGDKGYGSIQELVAALAEFLKASGMPKPTMVVSSGGGAHVYWCVDRALTPDEWRPLAYALTEAGARHGLKFDRLSTDTARVLRIPDTFNRKEEQPRPVQLVGTRLDFDYSVDRIAKALEPYSVPVPAMALPAGPALDPALFPPRKPIAGADDLSAGIETAMPRDQVRACLDAIPNTGTDWVRWNMIGMRVFAATEGADYGLEEWQTWSDRNVVADAKDTCADRWATFFHSPPTRTGAGALVNEAKAATNDPKWTPIAAIVAQAPAPVTPQVTGQAPVPAAPVVVPPKPNSDLPQGYMRDHTGVVSLVLLNPDGTSDQIPVSRYPLTDPVLQKSPWVLHFKTATEMGKITQVHIEVEKLNTTDMRRVLQEQGMALPSSAKAIQTLGDFFVSWVERLQTTRESIASAPFGWTIKGGKPDGFVYGGRLWTPTGSEAATSPDPVLARQYAPTGELQPWRDAAKLITDQKRPDIEAIVASAFAAPLVRFTGELGVLLSAYSNESGIGKSTALKVAQAVWGNPVTGIQSLSDTQNAVMGKLGQLRALPLYWDELKTVEDTRKFVSITFQTTGGKEKARMTSRATQREPGQWETLVVSASNDSLLDFVIQQTNSSLAGLYRVFEYVVRPPAPGSPGQISPAQARVIVSRLKDNYGQVGLKYAEFLGANHASIAADVEAFSEALEKEVGAAQEERFWMILIAVICLGARYAKHLGLADFDEPALKQFMLGVLARLRKDKGDQPTDISVDKNVQHHLTQFLSAMRARNTLFTNKINVGRGQPTRGSVQIKNVDLSKLDAIYVQVGLDDKMLRISSERLGAWLADKGMPRTKFVRALEEELGFKKVHGCLGSGTGPQTTCGKEYLLEIDMSGTPLVDFLDGAQ